MAVRPSGGRPPTMSTAFPENVHGVVRLAGAGHGIHDERLNRAAFTKHLLRFLAQYA